MQHNAAGCFSSSVLVWSSLVMLTVAGKSTSVWLVYGH